MIRRVVVICELKGQRGGEQRTEVGIGYGVVVGEWRRNIMVRGVSGPSNTISSIKTFLGSFLNRK